MGVDGGSLSDRKRTVSDAEGERVRGSIGISGSEVRREVLPSVILISHLISPVFTILWHKILYAAYGIRLMMSYTFLFS